MHMRPVTLLQSDAPCALLDPSGCLRHSKHQAADMYMAAQLFLEAVPIPAHGSCPATLHLFHGISKDMLLPLGHGQLLHGCLEEAGEGG